MTAALRRDHRDARRANFRWKNWMDITSLLAVSLIAGFFVWGFLMIATGQ